MDASHDQNLLCKIVKIWFKTCVICCIKYPIPISTFFFFLVSYLFFPRVLTILIYGFLLAGFSFLVHKVLLDIDRQKIKRVEEDDRRRKFAKSRRSFKSAYGDRSQLIRRNTIKRSDNDTTTNVEEKDDFFSKTLNDLLFEGKPKEIAEVDVNSFFGRGDFSSSNDHSHYLRPNVYVNTDGNRKDVLKREGLDKSDEDNERHDKAVRWTENDQKNVMDLGVSESETNKRLESLMERRKSRKDLGFQEAGEMGNNNVQVSAIKTTRVNPFLEDNSCSKKSPGSAPSSFLVIQNPFDIPYDPHEEKPDLSGDNFHEEFTVGHQKEQIYCRHQSFSLGEYKHTNQDSPISDDKSRSNHPKEHDETEKRTDEYDVPLHASNAIESDLQRNSDSTMSEERKADIVFFYGTNKRLGHVPSSSGISDLQVELSDEGSAPTLDELDIEKAKESGLNSSNQSEADVEIVREGGEISSTNQSNIDQGMTDEQRVSDMENNPSPIHSDMLQSNNHVNESFGPGQSSVVQAAVPNGLEN
uniref:uncharacterized protein LOC122608576 n=1 Tax=Erigeron canadensis TaxID=72917 RepID=UPI001CB93A75|nr:uncharacterized protein LOC122608576 [Erigeron canadensis]